MDNPAGIFPLAAGLGAFGLLAVIFYGWLKSRAQDKAIDPRTPGDDPSQGLRPTPNPAGRGKPPLNIALVSVLSVAIAGLLGLLIFANAHLIAKGPGETPTMQEAGTSQTPTRGPYSLKDFSEPKSK